MKLFFTYGKIPIFLFLFFSIGNAQWVPTTGNLPSWIGAIKIDAFGLTTAVIALSPKMIYQTTDKGNTWNKIGEFDCSDLSIVDNDHIWVGTIAGDIYSTTNRGNQWTRQFHDSNKTTFINYLKMFNLNDGIAMGDALNGELPAIILKTSDGGTHWTSVNDSAFGGFSGDMWRRIHFVNPLVGYFWPYGKGTSSLWKTTDGGVSWKNLELTGNLEVLRFYDQNIGIACFNNQPAGTGMSIRRSLDGGLSWETTVPLLSGFWGNDFEFNPGNASTIWFTDNRKLFYSIDTGRTWNEKYILKGRDIVFSNLQTGWVIADDGILIYTENGGIISTVQPGEKKLILYSSHLFQNFPNPFNTSTVISFFIPTDCHVRLVIYNSIGQEIAVVVNSGLLKGFHSVPWNATASSGVYFYSIEISNENYSNIKFVNTKKMFLLK